MSSLGSSNSKTDSRPTAASVKMQIWTDLKACAKRKGMPLPEDIPEDFERAVRIHLLTLAKRALAMPIAAVPIDDHAWAAGGVNGLSQERLFKDESGENHVEADMHGIAILLSLGDQELLVPIAVDLDEDAASRIGMMISAEIPNFVDIESFIDTASSFLSDEERLNLKDQLGIEIPNAGASSQPVTADDPTDPTDPTVGAVSTGFQCEASVICGSWRDMLDMGKRARLPMSSAMLFRTAASWDLLRAKISGLPLIDLPVFPADFAQIFLRSVRHDKVEMEFNRKLLENSITEKNEIMSNDGVAWFYAMTEIIDTIGTPGSIPGLSVLLSMVRTQRVDGFDDLAAEEHIPDALFHWDKPSFRNIVIGVNLNPVQALMLSELVKRSPDQFHDLRSERLLRWTSVGVMVIPNAHLSAAGATVDGRDAAVYDGLREGLAAL